MATINLGSIKFNWRGAYNNSTAYAVDDVVSSGGSSYVCILASTGNSVTNTTYWNVFAEGGDVATTLTTQGDILYRDGSGLQRLAAGTASQVLQMNTSANAPEWVNASGGYILQSKVAQYYGTTKANTTTASPIWVGSIDSAYQTATSITMTPASATSKFEIYMQLPVHFSGAGYGHIFVYRDIGGGGYTQLTGGKHWGNGNSGADPYMVQTIKHWDAPNTTSNVTYRMYFTWHSGTGTHASINDTGSYNNKYAGIITAVNEIDGSKLTLS